ncbi:hypothetical protein [Mesorhizobium sp. M0276]|uniref:hypothetical protein n=1 Tax=Mesorhizobium sp. M0276 TaxID=2956928 RepID=UPI00333DC501
MGVRAQLLRGSRPAGRVVELGSLLAGVIEHFRAPCRNALVDLGDLLAQFGDLLFQRLLDVDIRGIGFVGVGHEAVPLIADQKNGAGTNSFRSAAAASRRTRLSGGN